MQQQDSFQNNDGGQQGHFFHGKPTFETEQHLDDDSSYEVPNHAKNLTRKSLSPNTWWRFLMMLPQIPDTSFEIRPDQPLSPQIVDEQYNKIWTEKEIVDFETGLTTEQEAGINNGIPTEAMAQTAQQTMRWNKLVQAGMCTATYANDKFILQLTNSTIVAVLLSGFATAALIESPDFTADNVYLDPIPVVFQCAYGFCMLTSAMYCFAATGIALHSVNRLSNVLPSKSSVAYMTLNVFFHARDAVNAYVFRGMATACFGIIIAVVWLNQNIFYGIPAAIASFVGTTWFVFVYKKWDSMTAFHSDVGDKLCAKDMMVASKLKNSITEGLWTA